MDDKKVYKARYKTDLKTEFQLLPTHLTETAMYAELFAEKINLQKPAVLSALAHDMGKSCDSWAKYLDDKHLHGKTSEKEDHGSAGGQYLYENIVKNQRKGNELIAQLLAACVMYHHGCGLPDVIEPDGTAKLYNRILKNKNETHMDDAAAGLDISIKQRMDAILSDENFIPETLGKLYELTKSKKSEAISFKLGLTARFLSSCLIDGDRRSSAFFDKGIPVRKEDAVVKADWKTLLELLEKRLAEFPSDGKLNEIRMKISNRCAEFAKRESGIYSLSAATGSGKTLASLRYALAHAESTGKDRIFIVAPYTSILDQNADVVRNILDPGGTNGQLILEHHSNLEQSEKTEHFHDSSQTWNVPIIITTMVQFLEALFGSGTRKIRRMHQLANSVIIFDEVQTLPVSCTYLFNLAIMYLCRSAGTSVLLCTATQPGLDKLNPEYAIPLPAGNEIIQDARQHFLDLQRTELIDETTSKGWTLEEAAKFIEEKNEKSILTVVNTKSQARKLYAALSEKHPEWHVEHLSTNMCPVHRRKIIGNLKLQLKDKTQKHICISTRLIEAGVDLDFEGAVRFLAGFDSIIQTAGRCNREGELKDPNGNSIKGKTWIINIAKDEERIDSLPDLIHGQDIMMNRILDEFHNNEEKYNHNLLDPELIVKYFNYYYNEMPDSLLKHKIDNRDETVLDMLSDNPKGSEIYDQTYEKIYKENAKKLTQFRQSFESAWRKFQVISQDTVGIIVPFEKGDEIINELFSQPDLTRCAELLHEAQQYSVNVYYDEITRMEKNEIIKKVPLKNDLIIYTAEKQHYDQKIGLTYEAGNLPELNV